MARAVHIHIDGREQWHDIFQYFIKSLTEPVPALQVISSIEASSPDGLPPH
jgi:hypothetical protein